MTYLSLLKIWAIGRLSVNQFSGGKVLDLTMLYFISKSKAPCTTIDFEVKQNHHSRRKQAFHLKRPKVKRIWSEAAFIDIQNIIPGDYIFYQFSGQKWTLEFKQKLEGAMDTQVPNVKVFRDWKAERASHGSLGRGGTPLCLKGHR